MSGFAYLLGVDLGAAYTSLNIEIRLRDASDVAVAFADGSYSKQDGESGMTIVERDGGRYSVYCTEWPATFPYAVLVYDAGTGSPISGAVVEFNRQDFTDVTSGTGAVTFTYTLTSSVDGLPIVGADVWFTTDEAGENVVARGTTDAFGQVTVYLDAGAYYVFRALAGWTFDPQPDVETVS